MTQELRRALRQLGRARWSTLGIVLILALGTGANAAVLALAYGILLRPLPFHDPARLAWIQSSATLPEVKEWRARLRTADGIAGFASADHAIRGLGEPRIVRTAFVTRGFFDLLGVRAERGRTFSAGADDPEVVISRRLLLASGADAAKAVGAAVKIADGAFSVAGVVPPGLAIPSESVDVWVPADAAPAITFLRSDVRRYGLMARLAPSTSWEQARDDASRVAREVALLSKPGAAMGPVAVTGVQEQITGRARPVIWALVGAAGIVLLVACANVTSLLLARAVAREQEVAVQIALGASPQRVLGGLLVEGLLLAVAASAAGVLAAAAAVRVLRSHAATLLPRLESVRVDLPVLAMALGVAVIVSLACTSLPAVQLVRRGLSPLLRQAGAAKSTRRGIAAGLVIAQLALSIAVVVAGALLGRTMTRLLSVDLGVARPERVLTLKLMLGERTILPAGERRAFVEDLLREVVAVPGVESAGIGSSLPPHVSQVDMSIRVVRDGQTDERRMSMVAVRGGYLEALGVRLASGQGFVSSDFTGGGAIVVSRSVAEHLFAGRDPVGQQMPSRMPGTSERPRVAGVVENVRYTGLASPGQGTIYVPWDALPIASVFLVVRTSARPLSLAGPVRDVIRRLDGNVPVTEVRSLDEAIRGSVADRRLHLLLTSSFAVLGLLVALSGLVAALARVVIARRHELAVRAALGATARQNVRLVMRYAGMLVLAGSAAGLVLAAVTARALSANLFGVTPYDPVTYAAVAAVTMAAALIASLIPAVRAARMDPSILLRSE